MDWDSGRAFVYVILSSSGHVKIGKANNVNTRMAALRTASPFHLTLLTSFKCDDALAMERFLHRKFASRRANGEWFLLEKHELEYLAGLNEDSIIDSETPEDIEAAAIAEADACESWIELTAPLWGEL